MAVLAFAAIACGGSTEPGSPPTEIVFAYSPTNFIADLELFVMSDDGRDTRPLLSRVGVESYPTWSPDGERLAFSGYPSSPLDGEIFLVRADGSGLTQLTDSPSQSLAPAWSPDGSRIALIHADASTNALAVMNADGSGRTVLPNTNGAHNGPPSWSPDGSRLAFSRRATTYAIWTVGPDGSGPTQLTAGTCGDVGPKWSPNGTMIAFHACESGGESGIFVVNADGSNVRRLTSGEGDSWPSWAPDGRRIVFQSARDGSLDLYVVNVDNRRVTNLTRTPHPHAELQPDWKRAP